MNRSHAFHDQTLIGGDRPGRGDVPTAGVYAMIHPESKTVYVGSSLDIYHRRNAHLSNLSHGKHPNRVLQEIVTAGGKFEMVYTAFNDALPKDVKLQALREAERMTIETVKQIGLTLANVQLDPTGAPSQGLSPSIETREKIRAAMTGRFVSEETRRKRSESTKGKIIPEHVKLASSDAQTKYTVVVDGISYKNSEEAAKALGTTRGAVRFRCLSDNFPGYHRTENTPSAAPPPSDPFNGVVSK